MLNHSNPLHVELSYVPLPQAASRAAFDCITTFGFDREAILEEYSFSSPDSIQPIKVNALAFAHPIHRNPGEYASFTVFNAINSHDDYTLVSLLAESAAPFHLIHRDDKFAFWASDYRDGYVRPQQVVSSIAYEQLNSALLHFATDFKPQRIIDVKRGRDIFTYFKEIRPLQLSLWAAEITGELLVTHFGYTVNKLREYRPLIPDEVITTIAIQLLGALILADTGVLGQDLRLRRATATTLILEAHSKFDRYFKPNLLLEKYYEAVNQAYEVLRQIRFAGFVPDMLSVLYAKAYSQEERKVLGNYDTPLYLTRRILENIPIEFLHQERRVIADITCGWGSFLIAAHERLSNMIDMKDLSLHNYLYGNDKEDLIAQLAGLGLLISTSQDHWFIDNEDAFKWQWLEKNQPNIIVGNPPFSGNRKKSNMTYEKKSPNEQKKRVEIANKFLLHAITRLAPGGYLAMIMPRSFTVAEAGTDLRKELLERCDIVELWDLPSDVFADATTRPLVLFAQKILHQTDRNRSLFPVRVRTVQSRTHSDFKNTGLFTASGLVYNQSLWNKGKSKSNSSKNACMMDYKIILPEYNWQTITSYCIMLKDIAEIIRGAIVGQKPEKKRWTTYERPKSVQWLTGGKPVMPRPYFIDYTSEKTIVYPNELEEPRKDKNPERDKEYILAGEKVLVVYVTDPTWGTRMKVAIERKKYYVSDSFWCVALKPIAQQIYVTYEVLAAVMSWYVSNAWVIEFMKSPSIPKRAIDTIPFPSQLSEDDCKKLTQAILEIEDAARSNRPEPLASKYTIDTILKAAYHLDDSTFERLRKISEWDKQLEKTLDPQPPYNGDYCLVSGVVDSVDAQKGLITLWLEGFGELSPVPIVPTIPGWMLRPEAAFRAKVPYSAINQGYIDVDLTTWGAFYPQPYAYLEAEELLEQFSNIFYEEDKNSVRQ